MTAVQFNEAKINNYDSDLPSDERMISNRQMRRVAMALGLAMLLKCLVLPDSDSEQSIPRSRQPSFLEANVDC